VRSGDVIFKCRGLDSFGDSSHACQDRRILEVEFALAKNGRETPESLIAKRRVDRVVAPSPSLGEADRASEVNGTSNDECDLIRLRGVAT
jgi:hypothetical protein